MSPASAFMYPAALSCLPFKREVPADDLYA